MVLSGMRIEKHDSQSCMGSGFYRAGIPKGRVMIRSCHEPVSVVNKLCQERKAGHDSHTSLCYA